MKNEIRENFQSTVRLTIQLLQQLKDKGYRYVQVKAFTQDKRLDYIDPRYFLLVPVRELSDDPDKKEIYEPINSDILLEWAGSPNVGIDVWVAQG